MVAGVNDRCWLLELTSENDGKQNTCKQACKTPINAPCSPECKLALIRTLQADTSANDDGYIRVARLSTTNNGRSFWCGGSEGVAREWTVPDMKLLDRRPSAAANANANAEVLDVDNGAVVFEEEANRKTWLSLSRDDSDSPIQPLPGFTLKFVRRLPGATTATTFVIVENPARSNTASPRLSFLDSATRRRIKTFSMSPAKKNCTCLHVDADADADGLIAAGFADGSLLVLSAIDPTTCFLFRGQAHAFPVTGVAVDPVSRVLYSVSADGVLKASPLWRTPRRPLNYAALGFKIACLVLLIAVLAGLALSPGEFEKPGSSVDEQAEFDAFYSAIGSTQQVINE